MTIGTTNQRGRAPRQPRADGVRTRGAILRAAADLATVDGLEGLSIGNLAAAIGMSKSGLYAHFGTKQELQLATVDEAERILTEEVIQPALEAARPGLGQLAAVCEAFFSYVQRRVFPGGCFFVATALEMGARPAGTGRRHHHRVHRPARVLRGHRDRAARACRPRDPARLAFELHAILLGADTKFVLTDDPAVLNLARQVIRQRLRPDDGSLHIALGEGRCSAVGEPLCRW